MRDADDYVGKLSKFDSPTALFLNLTLSLSVIIKYHTAQIFGRGKLW